MGMIGFSPAAYPANTGSTSRTHGQTSAALPQLLGSEYMICDTAMPVRSPVMARRSPSSGRCSGTPRRRPRNAMPICWTIHSARHCYTGRRPLYKIHVHAMESSWLYHEYDKDCRGDFIAAHHVVVRDNLARSPNRRSVAAGTRIRLDAGKAVRSGEVMKKETAQLGELIARLRDDKC